MAVELREIREADIPALFAYQDDPEANEMAAFPARDETAFREHLGRVLANPDNIARAIVDGDVVVGQIGSWSDEQDGTRDVGYWIGREHWGNGYATDALRALLAIERERPLWAYIEEHNVGSQRVVEKCGFDLDRTVQEDVLMRVYVLHA
ncbi:MAG TPA: GNAT family N-acetyltransferase [Actinomycetota bacterium]|nr:GNAT family N-acetyltransferase [Actinomycetota bacterium]